MHDADEDLKTRGLTFGLAVYNEDGSRHHYTEKSLIQWRPLATSLTPLTSIELLVKEAQGRAMTVQPRDAKIQELNELLTPLYRGDVVILRTQGDDIVVERGSPLRRCIIPLKDEVSAQQIAYDVERILLAVVVELLSIDSLDMRVEVFDHKLNLLLRAGGVHDLHPFEDASLADRIHIVVLTVIPATASQ